MEGFELPDELVGDPKIQSKVTQTFQKTLAEIDTILNVNRILMNEINQNQQSENPEKLVENEGLIWESSNNLKRAVHLIRKLKKSAMEATPDDAAGEKRVKPAGN